MENLAEDSSYNGRKLNPFLMKSPNGFLVEPLNGNRYDNESKTISGFITSVNQEDALYTNRLAVVKAVPDVNNTGISEGDIVVVHHNVFRVTFDMKGVERKSSFCIFDDLYLIDESLIFGISKGEEIYPLKGFNFVKPVRRYSDTYQNDLDIYEEQVGIVEYPDEGIFEKGDFVSFKKDSEYKFNIGKDFLYRIKTESIWLKKHRNN